MNPIASMLLYHLPSNPLCPWICATMLRATHGGQDMHRDIFGGIRIADFQSLSCWPILCGKQSLWPGKVEIISEHSCWLSSIDRREPHPPKWLSGPQPSDG